MRALVTGMTGFVGGYLAEHLLQAGDRVIGWSLVDEWPRELVHLAPDVPLRGMDLTKSSAEFLSGQIAVTQPDAIYHLAAWANPSTSKKNPGPTWNANLNGTLRVLEAVRDSGLRPRILIIGTGLCYGPPPSGRPIDESSPLSTDSPYSTSKAAADQLALEFHKAHGLPIIVARPFQHTGPRQREYVLSDWAKSVALVEAGRLSRVEHGNLSVVRDYTDVRDIVRAYRRLIEVGVAGETYNVGSGRDLELGHALNRLVGLANVKVETVENPAFVRPNDPPRLVFDISKLRGATGWEPEIDVLERTLPEMLDYWRREIATERAAV
jgi:GDP-4-dehydro-6-deoxy-D-mannose reductase